MTFSGIDVELKREQEEPRDSLGVNDETYVLMRKGATLAEIAAATKPIKWIPAEVSAPSGYGETLDSDREDIETDFAGN